MELEDFFEKEDIGSFLIKEYDLDENEFSFLNVKSLNNMEFYIHSARQLDENRIFQNVKSYFEKNYDPGTFLVKNCLNLTYFSSSDKNIVVEVSQTPKRKECEYKVQIIEL